ncbi:hypothetical protein J6590_064685 [Homalodisca vitripennis]|nr:hypothetical protein J6590_064685 [Homalodisca vitripennis]
MPQLYSYTSIKENAEVRRMPQYPTPTPLSKKTQEVRENKEVRCLNSTPTPLSKKTRRSGA